MERKRKHVQQSPSIILLKFCWIIDKINHPQENRRSYYSSRNDDDSRITVNSKEQRNVWKLNVIQVAKKTPSFYGTSRFVAVVTRARHLTYSEPEVASPDFKPYLLLRDPF
jgi:hypothetical protein